MKKNKHPLQSLSLVIKKRLLNVYSPIIMVIKTVFGRYVPLFLLPINIARGSVWQSQEIYLELFHYNHSHRWWRLFPKQYKIGFMVEATLPSSYSNLFDIQLQILDDDCTPTKNSPGSNIGLLNGHKQFPHLVPETSKQISAQITPTDAATLAPLSANCYDRQLPIQKFNINDHQMAFWHHQMALWQDRDSARDSRTKSTS